MTREATKLRVVRSRCMACEGIGTIPELTAILKNGIKVRKVTCPICDGSGDDLKEIQND